MKPIATKTKTLKQTKYFLWYYAKRIAVFASVIGVGTIIATPFILPETKGEWYYVIHKNGVYEKTSDKYKATHRHITLYRHGKVYRQYYEHFNLRKEVTYEMINMI